MRTLPMASASCDLEAFGYTQKVDAKEPMISPKAFIERTQREGMTVEAEKWLDDRYDNWHGRRICLSQDIKNREWDEGIGAAMHALFQGIPQADALKGQVQKPSIVFKDWDRSNIIANY
jgi:hypothetical protein